VPLLGTECAIQAAGATTVPSSVERVPGFALLAVVVGPFRRATPQAIASSGTPRPTELPRANRSPRLVPFVIRLRPLQPRRVRPLMHFLEMLHRDMRVEQMCCSTFDLLCAVDSYVEWRS
jgi:hypothetical protein